MGTFLVPSREIETFLAQSPSPKHAICMSLGKSFPRPVFGTLITIGQTQCPKTSWHCLRPAAGTETHPVAPFLPRHLHDRDVEEVGDVGRSGQVPAAVETLRVVVGPAHQHWLLRGGCQGNYTNYKGSLPAEVGSAPSSEQGGDSPLPAADSLGGESFQGELEPVFFSCWKFLGVFVPCLFLRSSTTPCFGLGCAELTFPLGSSRPLMRDGVTERVCRYQGKLSSRL